MCSHCAPRHGHHLSAPLRLPLLALFVLVVAVLLEVLLWVVLLLLAPQASVLKDKYLAECSRCLQVGLSPQLPAAPAWITELQVSLALAGAQTRCHSGTSHHQQLPHSCMANCWRDYLECWGLLGLQRL